MQSEYVILCCDQSPYSGEGYLANEITHQLCANYLCKLYEDRLTKCLRSNQYTRDRILPLYLILVAILLRCLQKNVIYLNYCPLWNPLVMGLSRVGVRLGPITGSYNIVPRGASLINILKRKYLLPLLSNLGSKSLNRDITYWSATPSVHSYLNSRDIKNFHGRPFLLRRFEKKISLKKVTNSVFIYANRHPMKNFDSVVKVIEHFSHFKVILIGERSDQQSVIYSANRTSKSEFSKFMSECEYFLTLSYEDAGIASFEAIDMELSFLAPRESAISRIFESVIDFSIEEAETLEHKIRAIPMEHLIDVKKRNTEALIHYQREAKRAYGLWAKCI